MREETRALTKYILYLVSDQRRTTPSPVQVVGDPILGFGRVGDHACGDMGEISTSAGCRVFQPAIIDMRMSPDAAAHHGALHE